MNNRFIFSLVILIAFITNTANSQNTPQKKALALRVSDLINTELSVDYHLPIRSKFHFTISTGIKYYTRIKSNLKNNEPVVNYYTAKVNQHLVNIPSFLKSTELKKPIYAKNVTEFYHNTQSLNIYGRIIPIVTVPLQLSIRQYLNKKNQKGKFFINSGINIYAHIGQRVKITTTFLNAVDPSGSSSFNGEITAKFKEDILARSGVAFSSTLSSGFGWHYDHKEKFFMEVNPMVEFNLKFAESDIEYHAFRQIQPRILVAFGRYF